MKRKFLQQEIDDYQRDMAPYDELAEIFNKSLAEAKSGAKTFAYDGRDIGYSAPAYFITKSGSGDSLGFLNPEEAWNAGYAANKRNGHGYATGEAQVLIGWRGVAEKRPDPESGAMVDAIRAEPVYKSIEPGYVALSPIHTQDQDAPPPYVGLQIGQFISNPAASKILPVFPDQPNPDNYSNGPPTFTRSEERTLKGEQTFTEMDRSSKGLLDRIKSQDEWRPFADSNLGMLQKVMQGKV